VAAKLPEEGDKGLSDTAKQVSLLIGSYAIKAFDFAKQKDAESGFTKDLTNKIKSSAFFLLRSHDPTLIRKQSYVPRVTVVLRVPEQASTRPRARSRSKCVHIPPRPAAPALRCPRFS
jgi:hypothetical protein